MNTTRSPEARVALPARDLTPLLRATTGRQRKQRGIERVQNRCAGWLQLTLADLTDWLRAELDAGHPTFTYEQFKAHQARRGIAPPASPNAWGALAGMAAARNLAEWTGEHVSAKAPKAHNRSVKLWRAIG
ncbi:hypothetical protein DEH84_06880 [Aquabacterium olei]|uniref:Uncharacterized protein n=1 Tax=Aquabacterium olei TaxID=1296669 RepID=A0A2U8FQ87_9BURK|nr:hypothetical protein [Aquabacterium olei]AWI53183.1 hypothetical protein DEH84_06880 [Aquabacterium olei]